MSDTNLDTFWSGKTAAVTVERRFAWKFAGKPGELVISIAPDQPVPALGTMSEQMLKAATVPTADLKRGDTIVPELVFAEIKEVAGHTVAASGSLDLPVIQLGVKPHPAADLTIEAQMEAAKDALPTAVVAPGDKAVGWLAKEKVVEFYPLLTVSVPEELESYRDGSATTSDVFPMLPFQAST